MDLKEKITKALFQTFEPEYLRLEDDDGISGFVVSRYFKEMPAIDRQARIEQTLQNAPLAREERRRILMIAGITPEEYDAVGVRIRVREIKELGKGKFEIRLSGGLPDAEYVRGALKNQKGIDTTDPMPLNGANGGEMSFRANGTATMPLTKERVIRVLKKDQYVEVMANA